MIKKFFCNLAEMNEVSSMDVEEIVVKGDEDVQAIKAVFYNINGNEKFFSDYLNGTKANKIAFITGLNFPVKKKIAKKIASQMGKGNVEKILKKGRFPKPNSADIILLLN
jgi:hypothetical protein